MFRLSGTGVSVYLLKPLPHLTSRMSSALRLLSLSGIMIIPYLDLWICASSCNKGEQVTIQFTTSRPWGDVGHLGQKLPTSNTADQLQQVVSRFCIHDGTVNSRGTGIQALLESFQLRVRVAVQICLKLLEMLTATFEAWPSEGSSGSSMGKPWWPYQELVP